MILSQLAHKFPDHVRVTSDGRADLLEYQMKPAFGASRRGMHKLSGPNTSLPNFGATGRGFAVGLGQADLAANQRPRHSLVPKPNQQVEAAMVKAAPHCILVAESGPETTGTANTKPPAEAPVPELLKSPSSISIGQMDNGKWKQLPRREASPRGPLRFVAREESASCPPMAPYRTGAEMMMQSATDRQLPFMRCFLTHTQLPVRW